jgi:SAM-dependent methyltransferase
MSIVDETACGTRPTAAAARARLGGAAGAHAAPASRRDDLSLEQIRWQEIPVFIVNRNRHAALRQLVEWLKDAGSENVCILDNGSTYKPLLDWYDAMPAGVRLVRFDSNYGPWVFWRKNLHHSLGLPYVVTDSDLVPTDYCPSDLIAKLQQTLCRFPDAQKVGPSLRIDNLHSSYAQAETAYKWESQFWERPIAPGLFSAPVDTTFALYAPGIDFGCDSRNIRMGYPYTLEHTPWLVDDLALTDEERFYRANTSRDYSHWSGANHRSTWVDRSERVQGFEARARVLNLGCGNEYIPGWINLDSRGRKLDQTFPFEQIGSHTLPFEDDSVDGIYMSHSLQRVHDVAALMRELHRVARPGARLFIRVPHGASTLAMSDPRSVRPWFEDSFDNLSVQNSHDPSAGYDWHLQDRTLMVAPDMLALDREEAEVLIRSQRNVVQEMCITLIARKPGHGGSPASELVPTLRLTADPRIEPQFERL